MEAHGEFSQEFHHGPYSMTEEKLRLRSLIVNKGTYLPQLYCALTGSVCFGIVLGWSCPAIRMHLEKGEPNEDFIRVAGLAPLGASLGCALFHVLSERRGPRTVVLVICPVQVICWLLIASIENGMLYKWMIFCSGFLSIGFILCGEALLWDAVHTGYITTFMVLFDSSVLLGVLISYSIGFRFSAPLYFSLTGALCVSITFIMYYFIPESPVFLFGSSPDKAEKALIFYRGEENIYDDMRCIKKDFEIRSVDVSTKYMFLKRVVYRPTLVIIGVTFFREFTGYCALIAFGLNILGDRDASNSTPVHHAFGKFEDAFIISSCLYISRLASCILLNRSGYGIRKPIITSSIMITIMLFGQALFFYLEDVHNVISKDLSPIKIILNCLYIFSYDIGYNHTPSVIEVDYFPFQVYPKIKLLINSCRWLFTFVVINIIISIGIGPYDTFRNYLFLSCISFVGIFFNFVFLVETKGKTLMQIQIQFGGNPIGSRSNRQHKRGRR